MVSLYDPILLAIYVLLAVEHNLLLLKPTSQLLLIHLFFS